MQITDKSIRKAKYNKRGLFVNKRASFFVFYDKKRKKSDKKFVGKNKSFYPCGRKGTKIIRKIPNKEIFLICFSRLVLSSLFLKIGCREIPDFF